MTTISRPRLLRTTALVAALTIAATPLLAGCFSGPAASTTTQSARQSGNGVNVDLPSMEFENATLVLGPEGSGSATLIGSMRNEAEEPDTIVGVTINGTPAVVTPGSETLPGETITNFGYDGANFINTYTFKAEPSAFVPVTVQFQNAGTMELMVLSVPPVGMYEGIAPTPAMG